MTPVPALSQAMVQFENARIEAVELDLQGVVPAGPARAVLEDRIRTAFNLFPGGTYSNLFVEAGLGRVRRIPGVAQAAVLPLDGDMGGVAVRLAVVLDPQSEAAEQAPSFPVLARGPDWLAKLKVTAAGLAYANRHAWYGQPGAFLGANPLADGPAGRGWSSFSEGAFEGGVQAIGPVAEDVYAYGSLSWMATGSSGTDLFVTGSRSHGAIEDAYVGLVGGRTFADGSRLVANVTAGRQAYQIGDGMLIRLPAANGFGRAALQLNPRWTADRLLLAQMRYNSAKVEFFRLDPDELPAVDSRTVLQGVNVETGLGTAWQSGLTYLQVPRSSYGYYTPTASGTRAGLHVIDGRLAFTPYPGRTGPFAQAEAAWQWNDRNSFAQRAWGGYVEAGYRFAELPWSPSFSYRLSGFSGDRLSTRAYERWDPLLSGGNGEEWVQGLNHYKMFQDTNLVAHRFQARLRPAPQWELVPQLWFFQAPTRNNIGGTLSVLEGRSLGWEANVTAKYFVSRNVLVMGSLALTAALSGVRDTLPTPTERWFSAMTFIRVSF